MWSALSDFFSPWLSCLSHRLWRCPFCPCDTGCYGCPPTSQCSCPGAPFYVVTCGEWVTVCFSAAPFTPEPATEEPALEEEAELIAPEAELPTEESEAATD